jgi:uncharacterized protein YndB with AHSA1/START domain
MSDITTLGDREIRVERVFDAPRDRVYDAYTNPDLVPEWWGPHDTTTVVDYMDVRVGGGWRFVGTDSDGNEAAFRGTYREVVPNERIEQTFEWEGLPGHISVERAEFEDLGDQTRVVTTTMFMTQEDRDGMISSGMEKGMNETFERLDALLAKQTSAR